MTYMLIGASKTQQNKKNAGGVIVGRPGLRMGDDAKRSLGLESHTITTRHS
jgi:hypothetical protein